MRGRIFTIKKTTILRLSFIINLLLFVASSLISLFVIKNYNLWFFMFCLFIGLHLIIRSFLFKFDSSCYFGFLLLFVGIFYLYCLFLNLLMYPLFILLSFSIASYLTAFFYKQNFHYFLSISLILVDIGLLLYMINIITIWIFLAIILAVVILLICRYFTLK